MDAMVSKRDKTECRISGIKVYSLLPFKSPKPPTSAFPRSVKRIEDSTCIAHFYAQKSAEFCIFMRIKV